MGATLGSLLRMFGVWVCEWFVLAELFAGFEGGVGLVVGCGLFWLMCIGLAAGFMSVL